MCKNGQIDEAYDMARQDLASQLSDPWAQRALGWALYYMVKRDVETNCYEGMLGHIDELEALDLLNMENDSMIYNNVECQMAYFVKYGISQTDTDATAKLSAMFAKLRGFTFAASRGHSLLLRVFLKFGSWPEMADFIDWWNLNNLSRDDYTPYVTANGQKMMTLAERAYIAYSKALLRLGDTGRMEKFLPKLDTLMKDHREMVYPGYFYGKLLLALGHNEEDALKVIIPFAQKKATEFWVWQLLSEVFAHDEEKQMACLLRAVNCRTKEIFLGKVRLRLAALYLKRGLAGAARYQVDAMVRSYAEQGWHLSYEVKSWLNQPALVTAKCDAGVPIDYKTITDGILCTGAEEGVAVVTYVDRQHHRVVMVYGREKRMSQRMGQKIAQGDVLHIRYVVGENGRNQVLGVVRAKQVDGLGLTYAKSVTGMVVKRMDKDYAFVGVGSDRCFVSPAVVNAQKLENGDRVRGLMVYDYNKRKDTWNWICVKCEHVSQAE